MSIVAATAAAAAADLKAQPSLRPKSHNHMDILPKLQTGKKRAPANTHHQV